MAAYLTNRDDDCLPALERCHHAWLGEEEPARAARAAFWLGFRLASRGEAGPATGWFARGRRVLDGAAADCVERGYLLVPIVEQRLAAGDAAGAFEAAEAAAAIARRFRDTDLVACALHQQGRSLIRSGEVETGLALLDEAMVAVVAGELSPLMAGLVYCSVILACRDVYAFGRSRQWTDALARWCDAQPQLIAFTGACRVHRAEIMQLRGAWRDAIEEAGQACARFRTGARPAAARARLLPARRDAPAARRVRRRRGRLPPRQPVRLRAAAGARAAAPRPRAQARRGRGDPPGADRRRRAGRRSRLRGSHLAARAPSRAGRDRARRRRDRGGGPRLLRARADRDGHRARRARGDRRPRAAPRSCWPKATPPPRSAPLRRALEVWQEIGAPYEAARARRAPRPRLPRARRRGRGRARARRRPDELRRSRRETRRRAASTPSLAGRIRGDSHGLSPRELQVLRLVVGGQDQRGHRRRALPQRAHGRAPPQQHLHQARPVDAGGRDRLGLRARPGLTRRRAWVESPTPPLRQIGWFRRSAARCLQPTSRTRPCEGDEPMSEANKAQIRRVIEEVYNRGDLASSTRWRPAISSSMPRPRTSAAARGPSNTSRPCGRGSRTSTSPSRTRSPKATWW